MPASKKCRWHHDKRAALAHFSKNSKGAGFKPAPLPTLTTNYELH
jgi:hypothetical protein